MFSPVSVDVTKENKKTYNHILAHTVPVYPGSRIPIETAGKLRYVLYVKIAPLSKLVLA